MNNIFCNEFLEHKDLLYAAVDYVRGGGIL
jgi:hypothetical protein